MQLIFRASEHRFRSNIFHKLCDRIPHTLVLVKTNHDKIIGGYTPIEWDVDKDDTYTTDESGSSFLFSLSLMEKMELLKDEIGITQQDDMGPVFGWGHDLCLSDKCDLDS
jgi:hypothetical protein